jgi:hypothetical protein
MTQSYNIILNDGYDQADLYSLVTTVEDALVNRSTYFIAQCSKEQIAVLKEHEAVKWCISMESLPTPIDAGVVNYNREYSHIQMRLDGQPGNPHPKGNWGLIRHQSQTNNTTFSTDTSGNYTNSYNGNGVDIIMQVASVLNRNDPEFKTDGVTRLQELQWNTLPGMSDIPTIDYSITQNSSTALYGINSHAESVSYITAGNTYGWASGSKIYIWPRDQTDAAQKYLSTHGWDSFKLFHQNKGNSRPTIVVDAIQYNYPFYPGTGAVSFRNDIYYEIAPNGCPPAPGDRFRILNWNGTNAYGNSGVIRWHGEYDIYSSLGSGLDIRNLTAQNKADIITRINTDAFNPYYALFHQPVEEMIAAGVHHVSAAGNFANKIALPDNIDYNNGIVTTMPSNISGNSPIENNFRANEYYPLCREDLHHGGDTIIAAALASQFSVDSNLNNRETLTNFSSSGDRVDACAAGDNMYIELFVNGEYEATGTSFASPNIGGMAACVLGKYPTTTPAQLRKYFRDTAIGTDTLYSSSTTPAPSSNIGDSVYFEDSLCLKGYSGNIAYLDPSLSFDPSTISNTTITSTETVGSSNRINFTVGEINTKLGSI